jgi:hypothetical protein
MAEPNSPIRSAPRRRRAVSFDLGREMSDFAIDPPVNTTQRLLCSTEQASMFLRQFEAVTRIETFQLRRMLKCVGQRGRSAARRQGAQQLPEETGFVAGGEVGAFSALPSEPGRNVFIQMRLERIGTQAPTEAWSLNRRRRHWAG